jgi:hypothetical protein
MSTPQPIITLSDFGSSQTQPSLVSTNGNSLVLFRQPSYLPGVSAGTVIPPRWNTPGSPNNRNYQARVQAPGQILFGVGNGCLSGKIYTLVASGTATAPNTASGAGFSLQVNENYFTFGQAPIADSLFSLSTPISLAAGATATWSLTATLAGNGPHTPALSCAGMLTVGATVYSGNGYSSRLVGQEPYLMLSLGLQFSGSSGSGLFTGTCTSFKIQQQAAQPY